MLQPGVFLSDSGEVLDLSFLKIFFLNGFLELSEGIERINLSDSLLLLPLAGSIFFST